MKLDENTYQVGPLICRRKAQASTKQESRAGAQAQAFRVILGEETRISKHDEARSRSPCI